MSTTVLPFVKQEAMVVKPQEISEKEDKYLPFKCSQVRFLTPNDCEKDAVLLTGSMLEITNRLCLWKYNSTDLISSMQLIPYSEQDDGTSCGVIGDSIDEPRLISSKVHEGDVVSLKCCKATETFFCGSSTGELNYYHIKEDNAHVKMKSQFNKFHPLQDGSASSAAISAVDFEPNLSVVYVSSDAGRIASINLERIPSDANDFVEQIGVTKDVGVDTCGINSLLRLDSNSVATCNQLGQLKLWDLRSSTSFKKPVIITLRPGSPQPLLSLACSPGQSDVLAVGGMSDVGNNGAAAYIWDLRSDRQPITELACPGDTVWELMFHPRQPNCLYIATDASGLLKVTCKQEARSTHYFSSDISWVGSESSKRTLVVEPGMPGHQLRPNHSTTAFDLTDTRVACAGDDFVLQSLITDIPLFF